MHLLSSWYCRYQSTKTHSTKRSLFHRHLLDTHTQFKYTLNALRPGTQIHLTVCTDSLTSNKLDTVEEHTLLQCLTWQVNFLCGSYLYTACMKVCLCMCDYVWWRGVTHFLGCITVLHCVLKKFPPLNCLWLCQILTDFQNFLHCWKAYKICYKTHMTLPTHLTIGMLLHYLGKLKIQIFCRCERKTQTNCNFNHLQLCYSSTNFDIFGV